MVVAAAILWFYPGEDTPPPLRDMRAEVRRMGAGYLTALREAPLLRVIAVSQVWNAALTAVGIATLRAGSCRREGCVLAGADGVLPAYSASARREYPGINRGRIQEHWPLAWCLAGDGDDRDAWLVECWAGRQTDHRHVLPESGGRPGQFDRVLQSAVAELGGGLGGGGSFGRGRACRLGARGTRDGCRRKERSGDDGEADGVVMVWRHAVSWMSRRLPGIVGDPLRSSAVEGVFFSPQRTPKVATDVGGLALPAATCGRPPAAPGGRRTRASS